VLAHASQAHSSVMGRSVLARIHNPRDRNCRCDPDCWCNRTVLSRAVKWWFPGRLFDLEHKGPWHTPEWKREHTVPA